MDETYLSRFKFYVSGFGSSPFGIEWMRFDSDSPVNELLKRVPHIAFEVDNLDFELYFEFDDVEKIAAFKNYLYAEAANKNLGYI